MATIHIDGRSYEADPADNLLAVCLSHGLDLPYFCWHPALGSVGACRQCAVKQFKDENDTRGRIVMACMTAATHGTRIAIDDPEAREFRTHVIEWLMNNHPHDCPVCEEGGECHLQDMTVMTRHVYRRYRFRKRTFRNQDLGPFINHEMNRCITCYRCVRFYGDYAGGRDLQAQAAHNHVYFGRVEDGALENEFSGNLAEVCPTGVFDDKTFSAHFARKWDLRSAPSVCTHCGLGCNVLPNEREGRLRRILNRYNGEVNGYFICDRGRFGYGYVNHAQRVREIHLRIASRGEPLPVSREQGLSQAATMLRDASRVIGIGSPRASLEANFALRTLVGPANFYQGVADPEARMLALILEILQQGPAPTPSLREVEEADAVLVLGEDLNNTAPRLALSLRQAVRQAAFAIARKLRIPRWQDASIRDAAGEVKSPLFIATPDATRLDELARTVQRAAPEDLARLGFAVAHAIDPRAPAVADLPEGLCELARTIAQDLLAAQRPLVVSGTSCRNEALIQAAANVARALHTQGRAALLSYVVPDSNSLGLAMLGGDTLDDALAALEQGRADTLIVLENDLFRQAPRERIATALDQARHVLVIDALMHETARRADAVLPAGTLAESDGTLVNNEGRAQRFFQVFPAGDAVQESWRWLRDLQQANKGGEADWPHLDALTAACADAIPLLRDITRVAPAAGFRIDGMKIERETQRFSGRTAIGAGQTVHEPKPPGDPDTPLTFTMEGYYGCDIPAPLLPFYWAPGWNSVQALNKFQSEVGGPLQGGDPGLRLLRPAASGGVYFNGIPKAFQPRDGEYRIIPLYHIFGSEELSMYSAPLASRAPQPYLALNPAAAARLGLQAGAGITLELGGVRHHLILAIHPALPTGLAGLSAGLPGLAGLGLPAWGRLQGAQA